MRASTGNSRRWSCVLLVGDLVGPTEYGDQELAAAARYLILLT